MGTTEVSNPTHEPQTKANPTNHQQHLIDPKKYQNYRLPKPNLPKHPLSNQFKTSQSIFNPNCLTATAGTEFSQLPIKYYNTN
jgi:hypothetical protein